MEQPRKLEQLIDDYIMDQLDRQQKFNFEQRVQQEPELAQQVSLRREVIGGIEVFAQDQLKEKLKGIHQEVVGDTPSVAAPKRRLLPFLLAAAASVAILIIALTFLFPGESSSEQLYASYFQAHELNLGQRSEGNTKALELDALYQAKNYTAALPAFEQLLQKEPTASDLHLGAGISALELKDYNKALFHFNSIISSDDFAYGDHALWYSALSYIKQGKKETAVPLLTQLVNDPAADHHPEAKKLLEEIQ